MFYHNDRDETRMHSREDAGRIISGTSAASKLSLAQMALHAVVKKTILSLVQNVLQSEGTALGQH